MKCIAIDNDAKALEQICAYIEKTPSLQLVAKFDDADNARAYLTSDKNQVDVVFVDTDTNNIGGIDLVKSLIEPPFVVFVSNTTDGAYDALKLGAVDYLRKPFSFDDFNLAIKRVEKAYEQRRNEMLQQTRSSTFEGNGRFIFIKSEYKVVRINLDEIKYVESMREYVRFHLSDGRPIMSLLTIKAVENYLPKEKFMRVHRSYIVNLDKIDVIERTRIVFDNDTFIPISEQYKDRFQAYLDKNFAQ
ncbi:MAG: response regulator transcription factor [Bacteroidales bacterium]|jgi:two-component system LytT family response regulator|nr:response regulator transcription factor [Bacteroidales bacterium]MBQ5512648.1 response regulator transcription factor [Bacteroidales bacterium]MBQ5549438.1 response regulator transcription factor [Bacteroidales bacterium]MBQ5574966.1 response regulator transcription factor [Bacteroidales bacterium]